MHRLTLSLGFGLLMAVSIALKIRGGVGPMMPTMVSDEDIAGLLGRNGFAISRADPNTDPVWIYGVKGGCSLQIANVSLQGWHRSTVAWEARDQRMLLYSVEGELYADQPILRPMVVHYFRRLQRYLGFDAPQVRVRAIIIDRHCPNEPLAPADLRALSQ